MCLKKMQCVSCNALHIQTLAHVCEQVSNKSLERAKSRKQVNIAELFQIEKR